MDILIIGAGYVGGTIEQEFKKNQNTTVRVIDPARDGELDLLTIQTKYPGWEPEFTFFCLPTPTVDGQCQTQVLEDLVNLHKNVYPSGQPIIKSTIDPSATKRLLGIDSRIVINPEFLREKHSTHDFVHPQVIVFGGDHDLAHKVFCLYRDYTDIQWKNADLIYMDHVSASLYKYAINTFLAMKVIWANEFADLHAASGATTTWDQFQQYLQKETRIGPSHMTVPGNDFEPGFGGDCFPKDTEALQGYARVSKVETMLLDTTINKNNKLRDK